MQAEPTAYRVGDPGVRALFGEASRIQAWLDVEVALAQSQAASQYRQATTFRQASTARQSHGARRR